MYPNQNPDDKSLITIPLSGIVIYPTSVTKLLVDKKTGEAILKELENKEATYAIGLTIKNEKEPSELLPEDLYTIGNLLHVKFVQYTTNEEYLITVKSVARIEASSVYLEDECFYGFYKKLDDINDIDANVLTAIMHDIKQTIHDMSKRFKIADTFHSKIDSMESLDEIIGYVISFIPIKIAEKQDLLETLSLRQRSLTFLYMINKQRDNINLQIEVASKVAEKVNKSHREAMLREQLKVIQEELNSDDCSEESYRCKIEQSKMSEEAKKKAFSELKKLETAGDHNPESPMIKNYLDLMLDLPWVVEHKNNIDMEYARAILASNHNGLEKVKERIVQHLAVMKLKQNKQGSILLLVGPPGTGKTSLGKSIADALGREYVRASLGGVRDEAEIRGHRRTYIGSMPGRIIQSISKAGTKNPVFVLDEIDKLSISYAGDPASALLEVLDPEQNVTFSDHYLEVAYDLSEVFFIATANSLSTIPGPLLDRMEIIEISGYTKQEKIAIAKDHLIPSVLEDHGLDNDKLQISDAALKIVIDKYTREAGVRSLKKQLAKIARFVTEKIVSGKTELPYLVESEMLHEILGKEIIRQDEARQDNVPGVVTGLAWTPVGGDILFIEGTFMPGKGKLTLTGQLGDVMKESAQISLSLAKSRLAHIYNNFDFFTSDMHIHVPSGATPKDGPSAGVTLFTAIASLITGKAVNSKLAMTGEITLSGAVLPVGGIKEKVLAAHRAGIKRIILPKKNEYDLEDVSQEVRNELEFLMVETIEDVLKIALDIDIQKPVILPHGNIATFGKL